MDFKFILDKNYLLLKMISNRNNFDELNIWKNNIVSHILDENIIKEIESNAEYIEQFFIKGNFQQMMLNSDLENKFNKIMEDDLFIKYYKENLEYLNSIQSSWLKNKNKINEYLKNTVRLKLSNKMLNAYISHPKLNTGVCINQKDIFFGHWKGLYDVNYNIVYLCHENLHALLPSNRYTPPAMKLFYEKNDSITYQEHWKQLNSSIKGYHKIYNYEFDIIHSIIELISDNELYTLLSQSSKYNEGHKNLKKFKEFILPYWFEYLGLSHQEINERVPDFTNKNNGILKNTEKLNIENFIDFLINNEDLRNYFQIPNVVQSKSMRSSI